MKVLFIYPNAEGYGRIPLGPSILISILMNEGYQVDLFDTTFIRSGSVDNTIREKAKLVLPTDMSSLYTPMTDDEIDGLLRNKVRQFLPNLICVSIVEDNYVYADHLLGVARETEPGIPVIAGGSTPTVAPQVVIENPNIDYLIQGEGEQALAEFCELMTRGKSVEEVRNLWFKKNGQVYSNPLRPFVDMDSLPIQELDLWDKRHFIKPYHGKLYKSAFFETARGCMNSCSYCINHSCRRQLRQAGVYHRVKSIAKVIEEIKTLKERHGFEMIFFTDDDFLLMSQNRMDEFTKSWIAEVNLPYWINTRVEWINRFNLDRLKEGNCCGIGIGIESGSEWLRRHVLKRYVKNERIERAFKLIHEYGIRTTANYMIGFPAEFEEDIFETIKLAKKIQPKSSDLTFVAPYFGTDIHAICYTLGYIHVFDKAGFRGMARDISIRRGPVIRLPQMRKERLKEIFYEFMDYIEGQRTIPDIFKDGFSAKSKASASQELVSQVLAAFGASDAG